MLALDPDVVDAVWQAFSAHLAPPGISSHRLGCHRPRISDRDCFEAILFRLVTGCSWDVAGRLGKGSETTLRRRRDEWIAGGAFDRLVEEAIRGFDKVIGLDLSEVAVDGSLHKAPAGGEGTGPGQSFKPDLHQGCSAYSAGQHPQRDSNPCYRLERAASWAAGRWGPVVGVVVPAQLTDATTGVSAG